MSIRYTGSQESLPDHLIDRRHGNESLRRRLKTGNQRPIMRSRIEYGAFFPILRLVAIGCEDEDMNFAHVFTLILGFETTCTLWLSEVTLPNLVQRIRAVRPKKDILIPAVCRI